MPTYSYTTIDYPSAIGTDPLSINDSGQITGFYYSSSGVQHGFLYSAGTYISIDYPSATSTHPTSINDFGQITGYYSNSTGQHGFLYSGGTFTTFDYPQGHATSPLYINDSGQIVGYYFGDDPYHPYHGFLYSDGNFTPIDDPQGIDTVPLSITDSGQIAGNFDTGAKGFLYSNGSYTTIAAPTNDGTNVRGISDTGDVLAVSGGHGWLYSGGTYTAIDVPFAISTYPVNISGSGQITGNYYDGSGQQHEFLYNGGTYSTIDSPFDTTTPVDIGDGGQITGYYQVNGSNTHHGFLATPLTNSPPIAKDDIAGATKGKVITADAAHGVLANDTDPDNDTLHVTAVNGVSGNVGHALSGAYGTLTLNADGSYSYAAAKGGSTAPVLRQDTFIYTVDDGHGGASTATLTVSVVGAGQTYVKGTDANDSLKADSSATVLDGGNGNDTLVGGNSADALIGGRGNDTLTGGKDTDTFVFNSNFGKDVITDFKPNADHIQVDDALFANFAAVQSHAANDGHGNTVITYDANDTITLTGIALSQLHASDFFFV
jgi:VCBS repeat-containing protein